MTYHYVTGGTPGQPIHKIVWKGNLGSPIATCSDHRDAQRICDALNNVDGASSSVELTACDNENVYREVVLDDGSILRIPFDSPDWNPLPFSWIRVSDRMPDDDQLVLVYVQDIDQMVMAAHVGGNWYSDDSILIKSGITHWCDPAPPFESVADPQIGNQKSAIKN